MAEIVLKSRKFREARQEDWRRLERLLDTLDKKGPKGLSDDDLIALPILFRSAMASLSIARTILLDKALLDYLEALCARGYFHVYGVRTSALDQAASFFRSDWRLAVRALWRETLLASALLVLGAVISYLLVAADPSWYGAFISPEFAGGRDPISSAASLNRALHQTGPNGLLPAFAAFLFTHNTQVALMSYALGFMLGAPTLILALTNGCTLGALAQVYVSKGLGLELAAWLCVHGTTELFALCLATAAGFRIAWALAFPGRMRRVDALFEAGRRTGSVMIGVMIMLFLAGLLEGLARQLVSNLAARFAIGTFMLGWWLFYFYAPIGRKAR